MMDGGSNRSFILSDLVKSLNLEVVDREALIIYTFGNEIAEKRNYDIVNFSLQNIKYPNRNIAIRAVVIDRITAGKIRIPSKFVRNVALNKGIELADISTSETIHVLIGSDYIAEILGEKNIRISKRLIAADSIFGYLLQGREEEFNGKGILVNHLVAENEELDSDRIRDLWLLEAIGINSEKEGSLTDKDILKSFEQNTTYTNKRYETRLLWKDDNRELNSNYEIAKRRFYSLSRTLEKNKDLYLKYGDIISEQLRDGIIERVGPDLYQNAKTGYFLPHHAVVREQKDSTKVRIVFDASSKGKGAFSLNDCLESGPNLNPDLLKILLRFRVNKIAFCADIQRAFLEVGIAEEDRKFLKFLWIKNRGPNLDLSPHNIEIYQYKRVTFGVKCSPFLLTATIKLHLKKYKDDYPNACKILDDLYVDDLINGTSDVVEAVKLCNEMTFILKDANMNLRKWASNSLILNEAWRTANVDCRETTKELGVPLKILGIIWDNTRDQMRFDILQFKGLENLKCVTKRIMLSAAGMLFDPIGMMNPFTVRIKLLLQNIWELGLTWDEEVPIEIRTAFLEWLAEINIMKNFEFPRLYFDKASWESVELHIFSDASPKCYGAVAYFRMLNKDNKWMSSFIISKSRIAPLKKLSLPRLELMGALIAARLSKYLKGVFNLNEESIILWTDSQVALHWIKGCSSNWKQFIANRVQEIQHLTDPKNWKFCSGKENPADNLTRGLKAVALTQDTRWFKGPKWLLENLENLSNTVVDIFEPNEVAEERRKVVLNLQIDAERFQPLLNLDNYSDLSKVLRITSYVLRFIRNCKLKVTNERETGVVKSTEITDAERYWVRVVQQSEFEKEFMELRTNNTVSSSSKLYSLSPILTSDGLIALKGRLQNAELDYQSKHPIIIPTKTKLTELLIFKEHKNLCHSGVSDTLVQLRERFWIIRGRQAVKACLNKCYKCKRFNVKHGKQIVAPLPANRVMKAKPFEVTGIDFAGPLYTKDKGKAYIALFTCAVTRAIHLEIVSSLQTEQFLLAFRRFISRRGLCKTINSDNALTFKAADSELKKLYKNMNDEIIQTFFCQKGITWNFIVERAAWWGGYWERMVKMTKIILRKVLGRALVLFEELQTILTEIEAIINSRPLTFIYNEPSEPFPLTPAHFLIGRRLTSLPHQAGHVNEQILSATRNVLIKNYLYRERLLNLFWKRWRGEYLLQLKGIHCIKPINNAYEFNVNDIVLVGDDKAPRQQWKMAKIVEVHRGRDGKVRSATLKTSSGTLKRPIQLLYNLELPKGN